MPSVFSPIDNYTRSSAKKYSVVAQHYAGGMNMTAGVENLKPEQLAVAENVRYAKEGGVRTRGGFSQTADIATSAKIDTIYTMPSYNVMFLKSGTKIMHSINDGATWYDIGLTRTASERDFFFTFNKDLYATNLTDSYQRIAVSTLASALVAGSSTSLTVRTGDGPNYGTSGTIYVEGDAITYSSRSGDVLTITAATVSANHSVGAIVTETSAPSGAPKGSCVSELESSILVSGASGDPSIVYYSAASTAANPEFAYDFSGNGAGSKKMAGFVTALAKGIGVVLICMKNGIDYVYGFSADAGALLTRTLTRTHGVPNAFCIVPVDDMFMAFTGNRILSIVANVNGVQIVKEEEFDYPVRALLDTLDPDLQTYSFGHYDPVSKEVSFSVFHEGVTKEIVYQKDLGLWSIDKGKVFSCKTNYGGRIFCGDDSDDKIYVDNDLTTDNGVPILTRIATGVYTTDDKRVSSDYTHFTFGGLLSGNGQFNFRIYVNGALAVDDLVTANSLTGSGLMSTDTGVPLGSGEVGAETIGSSGAVADAFSFVYPKLLLLSGERIQFEWEVFDEGTAFELRDSRLDAETKGILYLNSI